MEPRSIFITTGRPCRGKPSRHSLRLGSTSFSPGHRELQRLQRLRIPGLTAMSLREYCSRFKMRGLKPSPRGRVPLKSEPVISSFLFGGLRHRNPSSRRRFAHMPASFDYAIIRVVPQVERQEFINAGVMAFCLEKRYLASRIRLDESGSRPYG